MAEVLEEKLKGICHLSCLDKMRLQTPDAQDDAVITDSQE